MTWRYHGACRNPLSDCRNGTVGLLEVTVGLLSDCRITVGVHCRTVGPGLSTYLYTLECETFHGLSCQSV